MSRLNINLPLTASRKPFINQDGRWVDGTNEGDVDPVEVKRKSIHVQLEAAKKDPLSLRTEFVFGNRDVLFGLLDGEMKEVRELTPTFMLPSNRFSRMTITPEDSIKLSLLVSNASFFLFSFLSAISSIILNRLLWAYIEQHDELQWRLKQNSQLYTYVHVR